MSLLSKLPELQELEQQAAPFYWVYGCLTLEHTQYSRIYDIENEIVATIRPDRKTENELSEIPARDLDDANFICSMRNAAPDMLKVLRCFQKGDAERLKNMINAFNEQLLVPALTIELLERMEKAARLMEAEG